MLRAFMMSLFTLTFLFESATGRAESQSFKVIDAQCRADYIKTCRGGMEKEIEGTNITSLLPGSDMGPPGYFLMGDETRSFCRERTPSQPANRGT